MRNPDNDDPPVSQTANDDVFEWFRETYRCSVFLAVMLHYQAVSGGLPYSGRADVPRSLSRSLSRHGWRRFGVVNGLAAYSRNGHVVCVEPTIGVIAASKTRSGLQSMEEDLGLVIE